MLNRFKISVIFAALFVAGVFMGSIASGFLSAEKCYEMISPFAVQCKKRLFLCGYSDLPGFRFIAAVRRFYTGAAFSDLSPADLFAFTERRMAVSLYYPVYFRII